MTRRSTVRASRLTTPTNQVDRGAPLAERRSADYWCAVDHHTEVAFASDAQAPAEWVCVRCGRPAAAERGTARPAELPQLFFRTPYQFLMMRRTPEEGERLLAEALEARRQSRLHEVSGR